MGLFLAIQGYLADRQNLNLRERGVWTRAQVTWVEPVRDKQGELLCLHLRVNFQAKGKSYTTDVYYPNKKYEAQGRPQEVSVFYDSADPEDAESSHPQRDEISMWMCIAGSGIILFTGLQILRWRIN